MVITMVTTIILVVAGIIIYLPHITPGQLAAEVTTRFMMVITPQLEEEVVTQ